MFCNEDVQGLGGFREIENFKLGPDFAQNGKI